jgi:SAM-dependent methyltransferase
MESTCNLCDTTVPSDTGLETATVRCNVRRFAGESFGVWRCPKCRSLHCREAIDHTEYYRDYPVTRIKLDLPMRLAYRNRRRMLERCGMRRGDRILDYGCGTGLFVEHLRQNGFARAEGFDAFVPEFSDARRLRGRFAVITAQDVLEHDEKPRELLARLAELLEPGGLLAVGIPDADTIDLDRVEDHLMALHQPYHRHIPSKQCLKDLGGELGLEVVAERDRFYYDTLIPGVNTRFLMSYIQLMGNHIDAAFDPPEIGKIVRTPRMLLHAAFGYFMPPGGITIVVFRKPGRYM